MTSDVKPTQYNFEKCFENSKIYEVFSKYLETSFNLELLNYIEQISDFNLLFSQTLKKQRAKTIIERFINIDSEEEINIEGDVKKRTLEKYRLAMDEKTTFDFDIFYESFRIVYNDLRFDAWTKFIFTQEFHDVTEEIRKMTPKNVFKKKYLLTDDEISKSIIDLEYFKSKEYDKISECVKMKSNRHYSLRKNTIPTINIEFKSEDLEQIDFKSFQNGILVNQMIVELMKPFTGVAISNYVKKEQKTVLGMINDAISKKKKPDNQYREFKKSDLNSWLANYYQLETTNQNIEKITKFLMKYEIIKELSGTKDHLYFLLKKKVVIVGCGFAGMTSAKLLRDSFDVTVIDKNESMKYNISFFKLFSDPDYIKKLEIPMSTVAKGCKFIQGEVLHISPSVVYLKDNQSISYDYLIVGTGCRYSIPFPIKVDRENLKDYECRVLFPYDPKEIISNHEYLNKAKNIAIVGTGPVGVEIISEIARHFTDAKITAITNGSRLLERQAISAHKAGMNYFKEYKNLEILFNRSVVRIEGNKIYFKKSETEKLTKNVEDSLIVDVVVVCVGLRASTDMFKTMMSDSLDIRGYVEVNEFFQVKYGQNNWSSNKFKKEMQKYEEEHSTIEPYNQDETSDESERGDDDESQFEKIQQAILSNSEEDSDVSYDAKNDHYSNIFAVGDITSLKEEKLAYFSSEHGRRAVDCIKASEFSIDSISHKDKLIPYKHGKSVIQVIYFGKKSILMKGYSLIAKGSIITKLKDTFEHRSLHSIIQ
eukprot:gene2770-4178_t